MHWQCCRRHCWHCRQGLWRQRQSEAAHQMMRQRMRELVHWKNVCKTARDSSICNRMSQQQQACGAQWLATLLTVQGAATSSLQLAALAAQAASGVHAMSRATHWLPHSTAHAVTLQRAAQLSSAGCPPPKAHRRSPPTRMVRSHISLSLNRTRSTMKELWCLQYQWKAAEHIMVPQNPSFLSLPWQKRPALSPTQPTAWGPLPKHIKWPSTMVRGVHASCLAATARQQQHE